MMLKPQKHIFVCSSSRVTGPPKGFCQSKLAAEILSLFREEIEERELGGEVFISNTGCLGLCEKGPIVIIYPDNVWYGSVSPDDVEEIMDEHIEGNKTINRLEL